MRDNLPTCPADLDGMTCIASVSSRTSAKRVWTDLSIWYRKGHDRPFVTVIEGKVDDNAEQPGGMVPKFRAIGTGSLARAVEMLDPSNLRNELVNAIPEGADEIYPDSNTVRAEEADKRRIERGYTGAPNLRDMIVWLYPDAADASDNQLASRFEREFFVKAATVRKILANERKPENTAPSWVFALAVSLRFFDRKAWGMRK